MKLRLFPGHAAHSYDNKAIRAITLELFKYFKMKSEDELLEKSHMVDDSEEVKNGGAFSPPDLNPSTWLVHCATTCTLMILFIHY